MTSTLPTSFQPWIIALIIIAGTAFLGFVPQQSDFGLIAAGYLPVFSVYAFLISQKEEQVPLKFYLGTAILARLILLFSFPNLSDDIYRFIWDGRLIVQGQNPFDHLPAYYLEPGHEVIGLTSSLFQSLNSPEYFTIYPPVAQATFAFSSWLFPESIAGSALTMKLFLLAGEVGTIWLLPKLLNVFQLSPHRSLIYALNPLIIVEIMGNLHYEGAMIFFFLLGLWFLQKKRIYLAAGAIALSIAAKLLPLLFLPFFIRRLGWAKSVRFFPVLGIFVLLLFLPLLSGVFLENFGNSLDLYFRKFEFNASVYYVARWIGFQLVGYNMISVIGPMLASWTLLGISLLALWGLLGEKTSWSTLPGKALFAICVYLLLTTTVHPWYTALPIVLCLFTNWRFPLLWSALILLTYINYSYPEYFENLWIVGLEYGLVLLFLIYEAAFFTTNKKLSIFGS
jgi:alpha-1,6-mannosyltransferase